VLREIGPVVEIEIHGHERQIHRNVAAAKTLVELDAVEDDWRVFEENVAEVEVAVALSDPPLGNASLEEGGVFFVEGTTGACRRSPWSG
jgi:hypothetical protein